MKPPAIAYKCGHAVPMTEAPDMALLRIAGGDPAITALIPSDHPAILPDIANKLLLERIL